MSEERQRDQKFWDFALGSELLTEEQLHLAGEIQRQNLEHGLVITLEEILLKLDFLTTGQIAEIHAHIRHGDVPHPHAEKGVPRRRGQTLLDFQGVEEEEEPEKRPPTFVEDAADDTPTIAGEPTTPAVMQTDMESPTAGWEGGAIRPAPKTADKDTGRWVGPYRIIQEIGRGGMGVVYKAFDPKLKRIVALKVLIGGGHASEDAIARFRREAEALAKIGYHPGIVPIFDMGNEGSSYFFAMAFVAGKSLAKMIDAGEVTPRRAMVITEQVARGLQFAHTHGVLHRDVKPENILMDNEGIPALTDFGLAKDILDDTHLTVSGVAMGTPQYMPPEQADGLLEKIDGRSDVYSLGATLYEMLTHVPPFTGTTYQNVIFKVLSEEAVAPRKRNPAVPKDAETICLKAMEKDPERRYPSAEALAEDVKRYLDGDAIQARPASLLYRLSKRVRRNPALFATTTLGTLALLATAFFFLWIKPGMERGRQITRDTQDLEGALERRLLPEKEAQTLFERAAAHLQEGRRDECAAACDELVEKFASMQGEKFRDLPTVRHRELLDDRKFLTLYKPYTFPLAQAMALKARALHEAGKEKDSLHAWLLAYAWAKPSSDPEEAAVTGPALLQIANRLLFLHDLKRARETFQKFLRTYPDRPDAVKAWFGLGETFWSEGKFAHAKGAFERIRDPSLLSPAEEETLRWSLTNCRHWAASLILPAPNHIFAGRDVDGDGRTEILTFHREEGLTAHRFEGEGLRCLARFPVDRLIDRESHPDAIMEGVQWIDWQGKGKDALLARVRDKSGLHVWVIPFGLTGVQGGILRHPIPERDMVVLAANLDGAGTPEIVMARRYLPAYAVVLHAEGGGLREVGRIPYGSYCNYVGTADVDGKGGTEVLLGLGEFSHWQTWQISWRGPGHDPDFRPLSPYHIFGPILGVTAGEGGKRYAWIYNRTSDENRRILRTNRDPKHIPLHGFYRVVPHAEEAPVDFMASFTEGKPYIHSGFHLAREEMFVTCVGVWHQAKGIGFSSTNPKRRWAVWIPPRETPYRGHFAANLDEDPETEVVVTHPETLRIFGAGSAAEPSEEDLVGVDPESEKLEEMENPILAMAIEMASMDWREQALTLFRKAQADVLDLFEKRRARLGEADCLLELGRVEEATAIYREMIRVSTAGITEELFGIVNLLRKQGEWEAMHTLLQEVLEKTHLPEEVRTWAEDIARKAVPLTRMKHRITVLPAGDFDGSYLCKQALKSKGHRDGKAFEFFTEGVRRSVFGRLVQYDGGPFRMETDVVFHRLDWTAFFNFGLLRLLRVGDQTAAPSYLAVEVQPGSCTNVPAVMVRASAGGVAHGINLGRIQEYPQGFPTKYTFVLEYAPSLDRLSFVLRDETRGKEWKGWSSVPGRLPPGKYCLSLMGSSERADMTFEGRFSVERFEMFTHSERNAPTDWEPEAGAFRLYRAGAALALGRYDKAIELAGKVEPEDREFPEDYTIPWWNRREEDPSAPAQAGVIKAMASLRSGQEEAFEAALVSALKADLARVFWFISRGFTSLPEEERGAVAKVIREALLKDEGALALALVHDMRDGPIRKIRNLSYAKAPVFEEWEKNLRTAKASGNPEFVQQALYILLYQSSHFGVCRAPLAEWIFKGTPLEIRARYQTLLIEANTAEGCGHLSQALEILETLVEEHPENPEALNALAWFLVKHDHTDLADSMRAKELAEKAVTLARSPGSPFQQQEAYFLDTLAHAHYSLEDFAEAVRLEEEALRKLPPDAGDVRGEFKRYLARFRDALEKEKGKKKD
ncbi:MAG: protein kinase domain-containing protein [Planctomycetota bacterium]|jgi:tetratricopeptide (TPR) repeat protein